MKTMLSARYQPEISGTLLCRSLLGSSDTRDDPVRGNSSARKVARELLLHFIRRVIVNVFKGIPSSLYALAYRQRLHQRAFHPDVDLSTSSA